MSQHSEQPPSVGRMVHYVSHGSPVQPDGTQRYTSQCRAAVITEVDQDPPAGAEHEVGLCVLNPEGSFFLRGVAYHDGTGQTGDPDCSRAANHGNPFRYCACGWMEPAPVGGTWHWPERV